MEQQTHDSIKKRGWQQLRYIDRQKVEVLLKAKHSIQEIASIIGYSKRTIERELQQGMVTTVRTKPDEYASLIPTNRIRVERKEYSAEISQQAHDLKATAKGKQIKLGKGYAFCEKVAEHIKKGFSPYSALQLIRHSGEDDIGICFKTLYNYIDKDYIPGITNADLPEKGQGRKRGYRQVKLALNNLKGRSIEERPPEIGQRTTFGHWEIDSVEGKAGTKEALLVLSERMTRQELIFKMPAKTQDEVKKILDRLEEEYGERFRKIFKTLTCDNGCEFLNQSKLEKSIGEGNRFTVYYCHPYSAYERGTNENVNRMIRRHIPKGTDIGDYSPTQIRKIQDHINSTPRLVLEGYPSNTRFQEHIA